MFYLRTGLMGHSKTLNTIKELDARGKQTGRTIYFHNITGLKIDRLEANWVEFDHPLTWFDLPENSIIVIDEAQRFFPVRGSSTPVPAYASALELMRKDGHELHCITQHPALLDGHFRKLCNGHIHYNRPGKGKAVSRWESEKPINVDSKAAFKDAQCTVIMLDSKLFDVYTSASAGADHHFKFKPPRALFVLVGCIILLCLAFWKLSDRFHPKPVSAPGSGLVHDLPSGVQAVANQPFTQDQAQPHLSLPEYLDLQKPRIADVPSSAPIYDALTEPVSFPRPFCVATSDPDLLTRATSKMTLGYRDDGVLAGCRCNSQQGTRLVTSFKFCMSVVENGYFDNTKPDTRVIEREAPGDTGRVEERDRPGARGQASLSPSSAASVAMPHLNTPIDRPETLTLAQVVDFKR